jgi:tetratricopeptide (TPR) repeat protein
LGCVSPRGSAPPGTPLPPVITKEAELPKRNPKASTCVAFANYQVREATHPKTPANARQEMLDQARKAYHQALRIDPKCLPAHFGLANLYIVEADYPRAFETYRKALQAHPQSAELWNTLGMCHARLKEWDPALAALKKAADLDPENRQYAKMLGLCLARAGRVEDSVACLTRVMPPAEAYCNVARMLHHLNKDEESKHYIQLALQAQPDLAAARELLASLEHPETAPRSVATVGFEQ